MRGVTFGYDQVEPCPACGTPRVGIDADDDYAVVPGRLLPRPEPVEMDVRADEVRPMDVLLRHGYWLDVTKVEPHPRGVCVTFRERWDYTIQAADAQVRVRRTEQREPYERLPGCAACVEQVSSYYSISD